MAWNPIDINDDVALGFGLDYRIEKGSISQSVPFQLYMYKSDVSENITAIADEMDEFYTLNLASETVQVSSTDISDNQTITIYYFPDGNAEEPSIQQIDLSGNDPITLDEDVFRFHRSFITSFTGNPKGNVYFSPDGTTLTNGKPDSNIRSSIPANRGLSIHSYMYVPPSWKAYLIQQIITSNCDRNNQCELIGVRQINPAVPNLKYIVQKTPISSSSIKYHINTAPAILEKTTFFYDIKKTLGSDITVECLFEFVLFK